MIVKALEIRDRGTFMPMFAMKMQPDNEDQRYLLRRAGYSCDPSDRLVLFGHLSGGPTVYDLYDWGDARTRKTAHQYIEEHFDELKDGDVIDVEFILGESATKKTSERFETYELE